MATISNEEVAVYKPYVERLASRFVKRDYRIEHDDLVQEGWIHVWLELEHGRRPTKTGIMNAMKDWASHVVHGVNYEPVGLREDVLEKLEPQEDPIQF